MRLGWLRLAIGAAAITGALPAQQVEVENTGSVAGEEVVELYVRSPQAEAMVGGRQSGPGVLTGTVQITGSGKQL